MERDPGDASDANRREAVAHLEPAEFALLRPLVPDTRCGSGRFRADERVVPVGPEPYRPRFALPGRTAPLGGPALEGPANVQPRLPGIGPSPLGSQRELAAADGADPCAPGAARRLHGNLVARPVSGERTAERRLR